MCSRDQQNIRLVSMLDSRRDSMQKMSHIRLETLYCRSFQRVSKRQQGVRPERGVGENEYKNQRIYHDSKSKSIRHHLPTTLAEDDYAS